MTHTAFAATAPDGFVWKRKTKGHFSHAVLGFNPYLGDWHIVGFRSTLASAQKEAMKASGGIGSWSPYSEVIIVETVEVK
jgi:hypothetical protein